MARRSFAKPDSVYELPDGTTVTINGKAASQCADILFDPNNYNIENLDGGMAMMIKKSIENCDRDLQPDLYDNIVLAVSARSGAKRSERAKQNKQN